MNLADPDGRQIATLSFTLGPFLAQFFVADTGEGYWQMSGASLGVVNTPQYSTIAIGGFSPWGVPGLSQRPTPGGEDAYGAPDRAPSAPPVKPPPPSDDPLPDDAKLLLGRWFPDLDLDAIRVHNGIPWYVPNRNRDTGEQNIAYTEGNNLYFDTGYYDPSTASGLALLAHELTHVRQQSRYGLWTYRYLYLSDGEIRAALEGEAGAVQGIVFRGLMGQGLPR